MKQKLFENIGGNQFKLITESIDEVNPKAKLVREGLKKVFGAGDKRLSYKKLQGVGLGYIKSVEEAKKTAIQEARILAKEYGYKDDEDQQYFDKSDMPGETDISDPNEKREIKIAKEMNIPLLDITYKSGISAFAPSGKILGDYKKGRLLDGDNTKKLTQK